MTRRRAIAEDAFAQQPGQLVEVRVDRGIDVR